MASQRRGRISWVGAAALVALALAVGFALLHTLAAVQMFQTGWAWAEARQAVFSTPISVAASHFAGLLVAIGAGLGGLHGADAPIRETLDVSAVPWGITACALLAGAGLYFPLQEIVQLLEATVPAVALPSVQAPQITGLFDAVSIPLAVVALPALGEELFFRGLLQPALVKRYGTGLGLSVCAILFGLAHLQPTLMVASTLAGLVLGQLRFRTGSVMPAIALHGAFNAMPILLDPRLIVIAGINRPSLVAEHVPLPWVLGGTLVLGACMVWIERWTERH